MQRFFDLDRAIRGFSELKPLGEIKLTTQKFYRINGGSTQLKGVTPDIILPDNYHYIKIGEREHEYPMEWTKIDPVEYSQAVVSLNNLDDLKVRSAKRDLFAYLLIHNWFQSFEAKQEAEASRFKNMFDEVLIDGIKNLEVDLPSIHADESKEARNEDWIKSVSKDIYIKETINIMHDMLTLK